MVLDKAQVFSCDLRFMTGFTGSQEIPPIQQQMYKYFPRLKISLSMKTVPTGTCTVGTVHAA